MLPDGVASRSGANLRHDAFVYESDEQFSTQMRRGRVEGRFVCEITDAGAGFDDPYAGYVPPQGLAARLWL